MKRRSWYRGFVDGWHGKHGENFARSDLRSYNHGYAEGFRRRVLG